MRTFWLLLTLASSLLAEHHGTAASKVHLQMHDIPIPDWKEISPKGTAVLLTSVLPYWKDKKEADFVTYLGNVTDPVADKARIVDFYAHAEKCLSDNNPNPTAKLGLLKFVMAMSRVQSCLDDYPPPIFDSDDKRSTATAAPTETPAPAATTAAPTAVPVATTAAPAATTVASVATTAAPAATTAASAATTAAPSTVTTVAPTPAPVPSTVTTVAPTPAPAPSTVTTVAPTEAPTPAASTAAPSTATTVAPTETPAPVVTTEPPTEGPTMPPAPITLSPVVAAMIEPVTAPPTFQPVEPPTMPPAHVTVAPEIAAMAAGSPSDPSLGATSSAPPATYGLEQPATTAPPTSGPAAETAVETIAPAVAAMMAPETEAPPSQVISPALMSSLSTPDPPAVPVTPFQTPESQPYVIMQEPTGASEYASTTGDTNARGSSSMVLLPEMVGAEVSVTAASTMSSDPSPRASGDTTLATTYGSDPSLRGAEYSTSAAVTSSSDPSLPGGGDITPSIAWRPDPLLPGGGDITPTTAWGTDPSITGVDYSTTTILSGSNPSLPGGGDVAQTTTWGSDPSLPGGSDAVPTTTWTSDPSIPGVDYSTSTTTSSSDPSLPGGGGSNPWGSAPIAYDDATSTTASTPSDLNYLTPSGGDSGPPLTWGSDPIPPSGDVPATASDSDYVIPSGGDSGPPLTWGSDPIPPSGDVPATASDSDYVIPSDGDSGPPLTWGSDPIPPSGDVPASTLGLIAGDNDNEPPQTWGSDPSLTIDDGATSMTTSDYDPSLPGGGDITPTASDASLFGVGYTGPGDVDDNEENDSSSVWTGPATSSDQSAASAGSAPPEVSSDGDESASISSQDAIDSDLPTAQAPSIGAADEQSESRGPPGEWLPPALSDAMPPYGIDDTASSSSQEPNGPSVTTTSDSWVTIDQGGYRNDVDAANQGVNADEGAHTDEYAQADLGAQGDVGATVDAQSDQSAQSSQDAQEAQGAQPDQPAKTLPEIDPNLPRGPPGEEQTVSITIVPTYEYLEGTSSSASSQQSDTPDGALTGNVGQPEWNIDPVDQPAEGDNNWNGPPEYPPTADAGELSVVTSDETAYSTGSPEADYFSLPDAGAQADTNPYATVDPANTVPASSDSIASDNGWSVVTSSPLSSPVDVALTDAPIYGVDDAQPRVNPYATAQPEDVGVDVSKTAITIDEDNKPKLYAPNLETEIPGPDYVIRSDMDGEEGEDSSTLTTTTEFTVPEAVIDGTQAPLGAEVEDDGGKYATGAPRVVVSTGSGASLPDEADDTESGWTTITDGASSGAADTIPAWTAINDPGVDVVQPVDVSSSSDESAAIPAWTAINDAVVQPSVTTDTSDNADTTGTWTAINDQVADAVSTDSTTSTDSTPTPDNVDPLSTWTDFVHPEPDTGGESEPATPEEAGQEDTKEQLPSWSYIDDLASGQPNIDPYATAQPEDAGVDESVIITENEPLAAPAPLDPSTYAPYVETEIPGPDLIPATTHIGDDQDDESSPTTTQTTTAETTETAETATNYSTTVADGTQAPAAKPDDDDFSKYATGAPHIPSTQDGVEPSHEVSVSYSPVVAGKSYQLCPSSDRVPPQDVLDFDVSGKITGEDWQEYLIELRQIAAKRVAQIEDVIARNLLDEQVMFHYEYLDQCIRKHLFETQSYELDGRDYDNFRIWIEKNCRVRLRYSLLAGPPAFELVAKNKPAVQKAKLLTWIGQRVGSAMKLAVQLEGRSNMIHDLKAIQFCIQSDSPTLNLMVTKDQFYAFVEDVTTCAIEANNVMSA